LELIFVRKFRIAVATKGREGLEDIVSEVFGRANTFTIMDVDGEEIKGVKTLENPAVSYKHGAGPIVVKMLIDAGVNMVLATELGPGASVLLEQHNVTTLAVKPGTGVEESVRKALSEIGK
jgi:predicted Fe-Mo cluster-binding NifX family protein